MDIQTFLTGCAMHGIHIMLDGNLIRVEADEKPKPATIDFIRKHKRDIIKALSDRQHGACTHCGKATGAMLTVPGKGCMFCCPDCFDGRVPAGQNAVAGGSVRST